MSEETLPLTPVELDEAEQLFPKLQLLNERAHVDPDALSQAKLLYRATLEVRSGRSEVARLLTRQKELLAVIAKISRTTPYPEEMNEYEAQRGKLLAEIGTLRSRLAEAEAAPVRCPVHANEIHGKEAQELRQGIENILTRSGSMTEPMCLKLTNLLNRVDARDSLAYLERGEQTDLWKLEKIKETAIALVRAGYPGHINISGGDCSDRCERCELRRALGMP
jgi:hypothetical protein